MRILERLKALFKRSDGREAPMEDPYRERRIDEQATGIEHGAYGGAALPPRHDEPQER